MRRSLVIAGLVLGCGKEPVQKASLHGWIEPGPSPAGFRSVKPGCVPPGQIGALPASSMGSLESVAPLARTGGRIGSDDRHVYWVEGQRIRRAERGALPWEWTVTEVVRADVSIDDLAVTKEHVYWTTSEHDGHTALRGLEKKTGNVLEPFVEWGAVSKLVARNESVFWLSEKEGLREISDREGLRGLSHAEVAPAVAAATVIAVDDANVYAALPDGIARVSRREPAKRAALVRGANAIAAASDGTYLYWLERGEEGEHPIECRPCSVGYRLIDAKKPTHFRGKLRRVRVGGGPATDVTTDVLDVETLAVQPGTGIVWIGTARGLVRVDPSQDRVTPLAVVPKAVAHGTIVPFGGALALAVEEPTPRLALLSLP